MLAYIFFEIFKYQHFQIENVYFRPDTEVFIVSSNEDINSTAVYPTAPYSLQIPFKNVTFLPDPCIIKLNGVTIGMTATDIYNHIIDAEIAV